MNRENFALITFPNSHTVLQSEDLLEDEDIKVIPLPVEVSSGCGLAIICDLDNIYNIINILSSCNVKYSGLYKVNKDGLKKHIEPLSLERG